MPEPAARECELCPHRCRLRPDQHGLCRVRTNREGEVVSRVYGKLISRHVDPMEKKPMYHFRPGTPIYSIAAPGCNLRCAYCQNWEISQADPDDFDLKEFTPEEIVRAAKTQRCPSIAYTYTEPLVNYEFTLDTARLAREQGLKNVLVSAGFFNEAPLRRLAAFLDGANIDLKGFSDDFYRNVCKGRLDPVLRALTVLREENVFLEVTHLVVPTLMDIRLELPPLCAWVRDELGPTTPFHLSRFHPRHQLTGHPPTPPSVMRLAAEIARDAGLKHVYVGNFHDEDFTHTDCPDCRARLIRRDGFSVLDNRLQNGHCPDCGHALYGVWE